MTDPAEEASRRAMALRGEFVRAFVEHVGPRPASERMTVRLPTLLTVAALCAVGALVVGVFWHLIKPQQAAHAATGQSAQSSIRYSAVAGWDCQGATDHGFEAHGRTADWRTVARGGWGDDGCHGTFETIPMTGRAGTDDPAQYAQWWFAPSSTARACAVGVYVPDTAESAAAASAAHYAVLEGRAGAPYAEFVINQAQHHGEWVAAGSFPVKGKEFAVQITDRGVPTKPGDRIAVAQLRVDCSA